MHNYTHPDASQYNFSAVAKEEDLIDGERLFVYIEGIPIVVINLEGKIYAIGDICSHDEGPLGDGDIEGLKIICPRHGAQFDLETGKVLSLPAVEDIPVYPVRLIDGIIEVGIPSE